MRSAVIVSAARTRIDRANWGAFDNTRRQALGGHFIAESMKRIGIDPTETEDVVMDVAGLSEVA